MWEIRSSTGNSTEARAMSASTMFSTSSEGVWQDCAPMTVRQDSMLFLYFSGYYGWEDESKLAVVSWHAPQNHAAKPGILCNSLRFQTNFDFLSLHKRSALRSYGCPFKDTPRGIKQLRTIFSGSHHDRCSSGSNL